MLSGVAANLWQFALAQGLIGLGSSGSFGPIMSDMSHWFARRRGIAVAIASCGNYLSGVIWPPIIQHFVASNGWRPTQIAVGIACIVLDPAARSRHAAAIAVATFGRVDRHRRGQA